MAAGNREPARIECDVVVVGGGNAGLVAAIEARNQGADVVLIEKGPQATRGGNSRFTYGDFRVVTNGIGDFRDLIDPADMPQREVEIEQLTPEFFHGEAMRLSEGLADPALTRLFVDRSYDTIVWLKQQGVRFMLNPGLAFEKEGRLFYPVGNANIQVIDAGVGLVETLYGIAERKGVRIIYDTAARKLLLDAQGAVAGVSARGSSGMIAIDAPGVVLCCGGFQADAAKRRAYLGEHMDLVKQRGTRYNTGDWIQMGNDIGAKMVGHWGGCHASPVSADFAIVDDEQVRGPRYAFPYGIMVNRLGARFVDEGENFYCWTYNRYGKDILRQPQSIAYQVFDAKVFPLLGYKDAEHVEAESLAALAAKVGIDSAGFARTIADFNAAIPADAPPFVAYELDARRTRGLAPDKTNWAQRIDSPPYRAYAVVCGLTMTYGGLKTDEQARVIDTMDRPIGGLYAVGEVTGGYFYHTYLGGSGLIRGAVMGRVAGAGAAARR